MSRAGMGVSGVWVTAHWPQMLAAAEHARQAARSAATYKYEFFTPEEAAEVEALAARIIPTDETPGAREAGVVFFIDRALVTFAEGDQKKYREGLPKLQSEFREKFPDIARFSAATAEQQDQYLSDYEAAQKREAARRRAANPMEQPFLETLRIHTISGFLIDPETSNGNRGGVGWKLIGREQQHMFQPPFGFYDQDYPGWKPAPAAGLKAADQK